MRLQRGVMSMCLPWGYVWGQQLRSFARFLTRPPREGTGPFESLRDGECQPIRASRYSNCRLDSRAGRSSVLIFPDPASSEEIARLAPRADERARQRE